MDDPYLWLEAVDGDDATAWVRERSAETTAVLATGERFEELRDGIRAVLDADDRIAYPTWYGTRLYNLWKDAAHPRGVWRRTSVEEYRTADPDWEVLLDLDALAVEEGESWVWQGVEILRPGDSRGLISLSRGGADAAVVREFDLDAREFVKDGFVLPEAKSDVEWIDLDHLIIGTDTGPGSLTSSGYPRQVRIWTRGTPVEEATLLFEGAEDDVFVYASHDPTVPGGRTIVRRMISFFSGEHYLRTADGTLERLDVPDDAVIGGHDEWLTIRLRSDWKDHKAGTLLARRFGDTHEDVVFAPDGHTFLSYAVWTRHHLVLVLLRDVRGRVEIHTPGPDGWQREVLDLDAGVGHAVDVADTNRDHTDELMLQTVGFLQPPTLLYGSPGRSFDPVKEGPAYFDTSGRTVRQFFATSDDGTPIPYFVVGRPDIGPVPTLLSGYGGFEVSRLPVYNGQIGRGWIERGGTYVVANIRGGGEYGPAWHHAAMRENRPRAYEDFAAVARDLVSRGVTTKEQLGIEGASNGGLLMGVMYTRYPELFSAVVCQVPLLDMKRYHLLLAGASWLAEYGDPDVAADWAFLGRYSPYQNLSGDKDYPPILVMTSTRDDRVHPGHARKMVARLRELGRDVSYYENVEGGHGAAADNAQLAFKWALAQEFLWRRLAG